MVTVVRCIARNVLAMAFSSSKCYGPLLEQSKNYDSAEQPLFWTAGPHIVAAYSFAMCRILAVGLRNNTPYVNIHPAVAYETIWCVFS